MPRHQPDPGREQTWRQHLQRQLASGLSVRAFCQRHGLAESAFHFWRRTIRQRDQQRAAATPAFVPVPLPATTTTPSTIDIRLASGHRLRVRPGCDRELLATVVAVLEGKSC